MVPLALLDGGMVDGKVTTGRGATGLPTTGDLFGDSIGRSWVYFSDIYNYIYIYFICIHR